VTGPGTHEELISRIRERDVRAAARAISRLENEPDFAREFIKQLAPLHQKRPRFGITGSPGVGKSTLVNHLVKRLREREKRVGVVAVDPTSPFSGGAILGDRIRMLDVQNDPNVYIRSLGSRGSLGGLSAATANIVRVLEVFGVDFMLIETVGMGQTGFDIVDIADTVALVLSPESGDGVQTMKAGVMEVADIYAVNKADRPGADGLVTEIVSLLGMLDEPAAWKPPVLKMSALEKTGVDQLLDSFFEHQAFLAEQGLAGARRQRQIAHEIRFIVESRIGRMLRGETEHKAELEGLADRVQRRELDTYSAASVLIGIIVNSLRDEETHEEA
jgi:LAO/AO transport system kinase